MFIFRYVKNRFLILFYILQVLTHYATVAMVMPIYLIFCRDVDSVKDFVRRMYERDVEEPRGKP